MWQAVRLAQQCLTLRNEGLSLFIAEALAVKLGTIKQPDHLTGECIPPCGEGLDLFLD